LAKVLGKVTTGAFPVQRGPDVVHRVRVPRPWLERGEPIELELPRNLACAACAGGGCDTCGRAGAVTMRGRNEPPEIVQVTLPEWTSQDKEPNSSLTLRIPEQGGLPAEGSKLPRGLLLLTVVPDEQPDSGVRRATASLAPAPEQVAPTTQRAAAVTPPRNRLGMVVAVAVVIAVLVYLRWFFHR
jgi:hypothetical protein